VARHRATVAVPIELSRAAIEPGFLGHRNTPRNDNTVDLRGALQRGLAPVRLAAAIEEPPVCWGYSHR
jgi:hypothetical protein